MEAFFEAGLEVKSVNHKLKELTWHQKGCSHPSHLLSTGSTMLSASDITLY